MVTIFPYPLGTNGALIPDRCAFVMDIGIILSPLNIAFILGGVISNRLTKNIRIITISVIVILMISYCRYDEFGLSDFKTYELFCQQQFYDVYSDHYYTHVNYYKWVKEQEGQDVVVTPEHCPYGIDNVFNLYLFSDSNEWVNKCVAQYCGAKSIRGDYDSCIIRKCFIHTVSWMI